MPRLSGWDGIALRTLRLLDFRLSYFVPTLGGYFGYISKRAETAAFVEVTLAAVHCVVWKSAASLRTLVPCARRDFICSISA